MTVDDLCGGWINLIGGFCAKDSSIGANATQLSDACRESLFLVHPPASCSKSKRPAKIIIYSVLECHLGLDTNF